MTATAPTSTSTPTIGTAWSAFTHRAYETAYTVSIQAQADDSARVTIRPGATALIVGPPEQAAPIYVGQRPSIFRRIRPALGSPYFPTWRAYGPAGDERAITIPDAIRAYLDAHTVW